MIQNQETLTRWKELLCSCDDDENDIFDEDNIYSYNNHFYFRISNFMIYIWCIIIIIADYQNT